MSCIRVGFHISVITVVCVCVFLPGITVHGPWRKCHKEVRSRVVRSWMESGWKLRQKPDNTLDETLTFSVLFKCIICDGYDGNVFNSVRAKRSSGTRLVVSGFRTGEAAAAPPSKSGLHGGADATTARGWRAYSAEARSHEWTVLLAAGASWYCLDIVNSFMLCMLFYLLFTESVELLSKVVSSL